MSYAYSFTATDTVCVAWFRYLDKDFNLVSSPAFNIEFATCSFSVYEPHMPVYTLGRKSQQGTTSSFRNIQGTMIFNIINKHPLNELIEWAGSKGVWAYSLDDDDSSSLNLSGGRPPISTVLPPINFTFYSTSEYIEDPREPHIYNSLTIYNTQFNANGLVLSVNNIMTEKTFNFICSHYSELETQSMDLNNITSKDRKDTESDTMQRMSIIDQLRNNQ